MAVLQAIDKGSGVLGFQTLAGAQSDGMPLGTIIALYRTTVPTGFLPCNGATFDVTQYPALYAILGTNKLPDLRECNLVGVGQSSRALISAHDIYTIGQFKDDQVQTLTATVDASQAEITINDPGHTHTVTDPGHTHSSTAGSYYDAQGTASALHVASEGTGTTTTSATTGISVESATTGITASIDGFTATIGEVRNGATTHGKNVGVNYAIKATTGAIDCDDAEIFRMVVAFLQESYTSSYNLTDYDLVRYDADENRFVSIPKPQYSGQVLSVTLDDGTKTHIAYYDGSNYYNNNEAEITEPAGTLEDSYKLYDAVNDNGVWYKKVSGVYYRMNTFDDATPTEVVDADLIAHLDLITPVEIYYKEYSEDVTTYTYNWIDCGGADVKVFATQAALDTALATPRALKDGDLIVKLWETDILRSEDAV